MKQIRKQISLNIILSILLIILISCADRKTYYEKEPNNFLSNASIIKINQTIKGNFKSIDDEDNYILDLRHSKNQNNNIYIKLEKVIGLDIAFSIYENSRLIKLVDDYRKSHDEVIKSIVLNREIYHISVKISKIHHIFYEKNLNKVSIDYPSKDYSIIIKEKPFNPFYEIEPNDTYRKANLIEENKLIEGSFSPFYNLSNIKNPDLILNFPTDNLDQDWYYFDLPSDNKHYNISIILEGHPKIDAILGIFYDDFKKIVNDRKSGQGESIINLAIEGNKRCYVLAAGIPHAYNTSTKENYTYRLSFSINSKDKPREAEINNSFDKANVISNNVIYGILSPRTDEDYYLFKINNQEKLNNITQELKREINNAKNNLDNKEDYNNKQKPQNNIIKEVNKNNIDTKLDQNIDDIKEQSLNHNNYNNKSLFVSLSGVTGVDLALHLYDEFHNLLRIYDNNGISEGETIRSFSTKNLNQIIIAVKEGAYNKNDNYKENYKLEVSVKEHKKNYELEPNNEIKISNENSINLSIINKIEANTKIYGYINPKAKNHYEKNDVDNYEVKLNENTIYKVTLIGTKGIELILSIYYRDGSPTHNFRKITSLDEQAISRILEVPSNLYDPDDNIYKVRIETKFGKNGNSDKPYQFIIEEVTKEKK